MKGKIILTFILLIILLIFALLIFFPFETFIKKKIEDSFGKNVLIKKLKIKFNNVYAEDIFMKDTMGEDFLRVKEIKIKLNFFFLLKKELQIDEIKLDHPHLVLRKNKKALWQLPILKKSEQKDILSLSIKKFIVNSGEIRIKDELRGFYADLVDANFVMEKYSSQSEKTKIIAEGKFTEGGNVKLKAEGNLKEGKIIGTLAVSDFNIKLIKPYIKGDLKIKRGYLNFNSDFIINKGYIKAPSILKAKNVEIEPKDFLMGISAPLLIKLLQKHNEIEISFNIWGRWDSIQTDLEKKIKDRASEKLGKTMTSPVRILTKPLEKIF